MKKPLHLRRRPGRSYAEAYPELGRRFLDQLPGFLKETGSAVFGMGCFWGPEKMFHALNGVHVTMVGYAGGNSFHANYKSVCTGRTGHCEVVAVAYDLAVMPYEKLLEYFWTEHDPTQGLGQGDDIGSQYRSAVFFLDHEQKVTAERTREDYQRALYRDGYGQVTTEIVPLEMFYPAEEYHQRYLAKHPFAHCGAGGTGVAFPKR